MTKYAGLLILMSVLFGCGGGDSGSTGNTSVSTDTQDNGVEEGSDAVSENDGNIEPDTPPVTPTPPVEFEMPPNTDLDVQDFDDPAFYSTDTYADEQESGFTDDRVKPVQMTRQERIELLSDLQGGVWTTCCKSFDADYDVDIEIQFSDYQMPDNVNFDVQDFLVLRTTIKSYPKNLGGCNQDTFIKREVSGGYRISNTATANNGHEVFDMTITLFETLDFTYTSGVQRYYLIADANDWQMLTSNWLADDANTPSERGTDLNYTFPYLKVTH